jgi:hypothetical protein
MPYKPREIESMLTTKLHMSRENADHAWFKLELEGLPPIRTKLPYHIEDIRPNIETRIYKQLRVRKSFFHELMNCTKYLQDYEEQIRNDPYPPFNVLFV